MFKVWKTVSLGSIQSGSEYRQVLKAAGCRIGNRADGLMSTSAFTCARDKTEVRLVALTVRELGFRCGDVLEEIRSRGIAKGLRLCPAEVGPALRLVYGDQHSDECLRIAMNSITEPSDGKAIFSLQKVKAVLWIDGDSGAPESFCYADYRFVFRE